jgi:predicted transcriptional regulator
MYSSFKLIYYSSLFLSETKKYNNNYLHKYNIVYNINIQYVHCAKYIELITSNTLFKKTNNNINTPIIYQLMK